MDTLRPEVDKILATADMSTLTKKAVLNKLVETFGAATVAPHTAAVRSYVDEKLGIVATSVSAPKNGTGAAAAPVVAAAGAPTASAASGGDKKPSKDGASESSDSSDSDSDSSSDSSSAPSSRGRKRSRASRSSKGSDSSSSSGSDSSGSGSESATDSEEYDSSESDDSDDPDRAKKAARIDSNDLGVLKAFVARHKLPIPSSAMTDVASIHAAMRGLRPSLNPTALSDRSVASWRELREALDVSAGIQRNFEERMKARRV
eukprot:TRINITY_DN69191_c0_g1_i1.p2 TRINITY_DN69191_c0_g1~~TRINITY_DN69191_c0_g1_i1.p2  ORF type:complete len:261 (+),score=45.33 TRINITY_DN69191_c0_g1_i1:227-1009(+)